MLAIACANEECRVLASTTDIFHRSDHLIALLLTTTGQLHSEVL